MTKAYEVPSISTGEAIISEDASTCEADAIAPPPGSIRQMQEFVADAIKGHAVSLHMSQPSIEFYPDRRFCDSRPGDRMMIVEFDGADFEVRVLPLEPPDA